MMTVGAYEAKTRLSELLDKVAAGERVVITRHGTAVAVLQGADPSPVAGVAAALDAARALRMECSASKGEIRDWTDEGRR